MNKKKNILITALETEVQRLETELTAHNNSYRNSLMGVTYRGWWDIHTALSQQLNETAIALNVSRKMWSRVQQKAAL